MNVKHKTKITISPPDGSSLKQAVIYVSQDYIDDERFDILKKACERAAQEFVCLNEWEIWKKRPEKD